MRAEKTKLTNGYTEAARLGISPSTYEEMKKFFAEKAVPKILQKRKEENGTAREAVREE